MTDDRSNLAADRADLAETRADLASDRADVAAGRADRSDQRADLSDKRADKTDTTIAELGETLERISCLMGESLKRLEDKLDLELDREREARAKALAVEARHRRHQYRKLIVGALVGIIAAAVFVVGFHRQSVHLCDGQNQNRALLSSLITQSTAPAAAPPGSSPELLQAFADANRRGIEFRAQAAPLLKPADCSHLGWLS